MIEVRGRFGGTPLHVAAGFEMGPTCKVLANHPDLEVNAIDAEMGETPLIAAAYSGMDEIVQILLARNADVNVKNVEGDTALSVAQKEGKSAVVALLLNA